MSTFVGTEGCTAFGARFEKKNTKLGAKVNSYLELQQKSQHITN
jgi:hypothetical protein